MIPLRLIHIALLLFLLASCAESQEPEEEVEKPLSDQRLAAVPQDTLVTKENPEALKPLHYDTLPDSAFVELIRLDSTFILDVRYATSDNFMGKPVYPCPVVLLRKVAAQALVEAQQAFRAKGYQIKVFDGYRPLSVQWELWNTTPNKNYVANPRYGSNHNRGLAVDITLVDMETGQQVDMGTKYDFFGRRAHHTYTNLSEQVQTNRLLLKQTMERHGFSSIRSEWWHYNFKARFPLSDRELPCP